MMHLKSMRNIHLKIHKYTKSITNSIYITTFHVFHFHNTNGYN